jgi:hypothetical protein
VFRRPAGERASRSIKAAGRATWLAIVLSAAVTGVASADDYVFGNDPIDYDGFKDGSKPARVTIDDNNVITITNPAGNAQSVMGWDIDFETTEGVRAVRPMEDCYIAETWNRSNGQSPSTFGCSGVVEPGATKSWAVTADGRINDGLGSFPGILVSWIDNDCAGAAARVFGATLDECHRERLGTPRVWARRINHSAITMRIRGAPPYWATRVYGAPSRAKLKTSRSGKTLATVGPSPSGYPRYGSGKVRAARTIKFVREAWIKPGERPILSPIARVIK